MKVRDRFWALFISAPLLASINLVGCTPASTTANFSLEIANINGPTVDVLVNGQKVTQVKCQIESASPAPVLTPGPNLPLPWSVSVVASASGASLGTWGEDGKDGPRMLLIRGNEVAEVPSGISAGPVAQGICGQ